MGAEQAPRKNADLGTRLVSAVVMLALAVGAVIAGGKVLDGFIAMVALLTYAEFAVLVVKATASPAKRVGGLLAGLVYIGLAALMLAQMEPALLVIAVGAVIFTDSGAYFAGRAIGGPKVAPAISPSKTWAGVAGGTIASGLWVAFAIAFLRYSLSALGAEGPSGGDAVLAWQVGAGFLSGAALAIAAQAGDFFQSWLKRRAGVKDSSRLIPGHGGVFDRTDGLIPVAILVGGAWVLAG